MPQKAKLRSAMSARLTALHAETNLPQPYEVAEGLVVTPPGRKRSMAMAEAETRLYVYRALLQQAVARSSEDEQPAESDLNALTAQVTKASEDYERAFFGDAYDAVLTYFEDDAIPVQMWSAFVEDIKSEFLPTVPDDGKCPMCGHVEDEEAAGKAPESST